MFDPVYELAQAADRFERWPRVIVTRLKYGGFKVVPEKKKRRRHAKKALGIEGKED